MTPISKADLTKQLIAAAQSGTLITGKHDPANAAIPAPTYRSVLTAPASSSLVSELTAGNVVVTEYQSAKYSSPQYVAEFTSGSVSPVGLGIPSGSSTPVSQCDRLVFVSGSKQGWHVYADEQAHIGKMVASGALTYVGPLK